MNGEKRVSREDVRELREAAGEKSFGEIIRLFLERYGSRTALASSLGAEDQALTHILLGIHPDARIFVLDTGRLHEETYDLMERTMSRYGMRYEIYFPDAADVEDMAGSRGPNLFYRSTEDRRHCCHVRKVKPLQRVLRTLDVWITGLRREQSSTRNSIEKIEWDEANGLIKLNPLADWSENEVWDYIKVHNVPYNSLHDQGFPSIGCAPCTRAVSPGEDVRSGRWWWENPEQRECGLHKESGRLRRRKEYGSS